MKSKKKKGSRKEVVFLTIIGTILLIIIFFGKNFFREKPATKPARKDYNCGQNTNCVIIQGKDTTIQRSDLTQLNFSLPTNWIVSRGLKGNSGPRYEIWHSKQVEVFDMDSGGILLKKNNETVLDIYDMYRKRDFESQDFLTITNKILLMYLYPVAIGQQFNRETDVFLNRRDFVTGARYFLIQYPHYFIWKTDIGKPISKDDYIPVFSSYNRFNFYIGDTTEYIVEIYDYKKIPVEDVLTMLQYLKITEK